MNIDLKSIELSKTNPRHALDSTAFEELMDSIREKGIQEPILVRPIPIYRSNQPKNRYELIDGYRRFSAAENLKLKEIPAIVQEMTNEQVVEYQMLMFIHRQGLKPMEEAEGYKRMMDTLHYTFDMLVAKTGKKKSDIRRSLQLLELPDDVKKYLWQGKFSVGAANEIARLPEKIREKATVALLTEMKNHSYRPMTDKDVSVFVKDRFMLNLAKAPFNTKDETLLPEAGPCSTCPKRTKNAQELFCDISKEDLCTDKKCYQKKKDLSWENTVAKYQKMGFTVLTPQEGKKIWSNWTSNHIAWGYENTYVTASMKCSVATDKKYSSKSYKEILGKSIPNPLILKDDEHKVHKVYLKQDCIDALKAKGIKTKKIGKDDREIIPPTPEEKEQLKKEQEEATFIEKQAHYKTIETMLDRVARGIVPDADGKKKSDWKFIIRRILEVCDSWGDRMDLGPVAKRRLGLTDEEMDKMDRDDFYSKIQEEDILGLCYELLYWEDTDSNPRVFNKHFLEVWGIDLIKVFTEQKRKIAKEVTADKKKAKTTSPEEEVKL